MFQVTLTQIKKNISIVLAALAADAGPGSTMFPISTDAFPQRLNPVSSFSAHIACPPPPSVPPPSPPLIGAWQDQALLLICSSLTLAQFALCVFVLLVEIGRAHV